MYIAFSVKNVGVGAGCLHKLRRVIVRGTYVIVWNVFVIFGLVVPEVVCVRYVIICSQKDISNVCIPVIYLYVIKEYILVSACDGRKG